MDNLLHSSVNSKTYSNSGNTIVLSEVPSDIPCTILDLGCGAGDNARRLVENGHTVDGITLSDSEFSLASKWCREVWIYDLEKGLPPHAYEQNYDFVICSHVLEHIAYPENLLRGITRINFKNRFISERNKKDWGGAIIALPNPMFMRNRLNWLKGNFEYQKTGLMDYTHLRFYTFSTARRLFKERGFTVLKQFGSGYFPLGPLRRISKALAGRIDKLAVRSFPAWFSTQMILVVKPLETKGEPK